MSFDSIVPAIIGRTRTALRTTREFSAGFADIYQASSPLTDLISQRSDVDEEQLHELVDAIFEAFSRHPVMGQLRGLTEQMRAKNYLPNEKSTEDLIRSMISRASGAGSGLVPVQITDEFWRFFNELASETELNGLGEISLDVMRIIVDAYEPMILKILNQLKDMRNTSDRQMRDLLNQVALIRYDLDIFRRQIQALRHIREFFDTDPSDYKAQAEIVAQMVREFGPFFIKLAQVAAANSDFLPEEMSEALAVFQEDVEPMSALEVEQAFLECFKEHPEKRYYDFDASKPLKSGSIASVYVAHRPLDPDAKEKVLTPMVVKVGRHNLEREFLVGKTVIKLAILTSQYWAPHSKLSPFLESFLAQTDVFVEGFNQELDFEEEARIQTLFNERAVVDSQWHVPKVYESTRRIIEMELIDQAASLNKAFDGLTGAKNQRARRKIGRAYLHALLTHMLVYKEFHGDLHQGNIMVRKQQQLYFIDWGNSVDLTGLWRSVLLYMGAVFSGNTKAVVDSVMNLCADPDVIISQRADIEEAVQKTFDDAGLEPLGVFFIYTLVKEGEEGIKKRLEMALNLMSALTRKGVTIQGDYMHLSRSVMAMIGSYAGLYKGISKYHLILDALQVLSKFPAITTKNLLLNKDREDLLKVPV